MPVPWKTAAAFAAFGLAVVAASAFGARARDAHGSSERAHPATRTTAAETPSPPDGRAPRPPSPAVDDSLEASGLQAVKDAYESTGDVARRAELLGRASTLSDPSVVPWLVDIAESDSAMASQASAALGAVSAPAAGRGLLEIVTGSAPSLVRANAARALGRCGGPREAAVLATMIRDSGQPLRVRQEAALALGNIGDPSVVPSLIATVEQAARDTTVDGEQLRISMVQALGALSSEEAQDFLKRYAREKLSPTERAFVSRALRRSS